MPWSGHEDRQIQDYFINTAFPPRADAEQVMALLDEDEWMTAKAIERDVNMRHARLENMLKVLEVEGVVERNRGKWRRTPREWEYPEARVTAVTAARRAEQERMREYLSVSGCLMEFLQRELNDPSAAPCGRCSWCVGGALLPVVIDRELARQAVGFLRGQTLTLEPRKQWPDGKKIPVDQRAEVGRVCRTSPTAVGAPRCRSSALSARIRTRSRGRWLIWLRSNRTTPISSG